MRTMQVLKEEGHASVSKLSKRFSVSEVTIRKDLRALEERNVLVRTHGGAVLIDHYMYDLPFDKQALRNAQEKRRIGKAAAERVADNDTLVLSGGSTTAQVAHHLRSKKNLTVTTNSVHVVQELLHNLEIDLLLLGGLVHPATASVVGPYAEQMLREHAFNRLFLGADGYDIGHGVTTTNMMEAHLYRLMIQTARQVIMVADASKFGRRGLSRVCDVNDIDVVITDKNIPPAFAEHFKAADVEVVLV
jgi:DeoR family transcriptional regulator of aga operon